MYYNSAHNTSQARDFSLHNSFVTLLALIIVSKFETGLGCNIQIINGLVKLKLSLV